MSGLNLSYLTSPTPSVCSCSCLQMFQSLHKRGYRLLFLSTNPVLTKASDGLSLTVTVS